MKRVLAVFALTCVAVAAVTLARASDTPKQLSFVYQDGRAVAESQSGLRVHEASLDAVRGKVHVYATFEMGPVNPLKYVEGRPQWRETVDQAGQAGGVETTETAGFIEDKTAVVAQRKGQPQNLQIVSLGEKAGEKFTPALRFGLANDGRAPVGVAHVTPWLGDGELDYFGMYARPETPCDFKMTLDLGSGRSSVWVSGRGDDDWFLLAENVPLINPVGTINHVQVLQYPGAPAIGGVAVLQEPWPGGEKVRPHPLAKKDRTVGAGKGFKFQAMRSTWGKPGKHVRVARKPGVHHGFPEVARWGTRRLVCTWRNGSHTGGTGGISVARSEDLGKTWGEPQLVHAGGGNCSRIQKLADGSLMLPIDVSGEKILLYRSEDGGVTWEKWGALQSNKPGGRGGLVPSRVLELSDGAWLVSTSWYGGGSPPGGITSAETLQFFRSTDRGKTWTDWSELQIAPYNLSEASLIELADGRLLLFAREWRYDAMPAVKAFSNDKGKTWKVHELPFPMTGRTCAELLSDGRVMVTFRTGVGRAGLRAWIGDPDDPTTFQPTGAHFNDRHTVGIKDGALHIDNDGRCGQFTLYNFRPPDGPKGTVDVTAEVKVVSNQGRAATLSVPWAGKFRLFPDHVEMAHDASLRVDVSPGVFHTYRVESRVGQMKLYVDGQLKLDTDKGDDRLRPFAANKLSYYAMGFGNEQRGSWLTDGEVKNSEPDVYDRNITPQVTGYSIWRRVEETLDDPHTGRRVISWVAARDGFPDQYQLDHIIEVGMCASGHENGYSGWVEMDDGRIFVVNYTDDTAAATHPTAYLFGVPWIRGTLLERSDLPPSKR